ncbi:MAG: malate dehydrogenase [Opitutae bacterium]|nr:malate dehydrogenase [Opitutae bacterium]|tara:strand:- start:547 stop:1638 length:1092 start_codon:yes stop_codon:yes gene_type:complete
MSNPELTLLPSERLAEFSRRVFEHFGIPADDAALASEVLAASDIRGIDSHGVARLHAYFEMLTAGRINPCPQLTILRESPSTATVDGDNGLGLVVGPKANEIAMSKAEDAGTGWVSVSNTNHYGIAGYYVLKALEKDLIGWSMTNTTKLVAPLWGTERKLGTNPIAIAFPGKEEPPIVIDMASCSAAYGKIEIALRKGAEIPRGWAIDGQGQDTLDPGEMIEEGALLPLGSDRERGGHKGYGLAIMVDVLSCVLSGANWGPFAPPFALRQEIPDKQVGKGIGHFFGAMRIDAFIDPDEFKSQIDAYRREMQSSHPSPGTDGPLIPGDPELEAEKIRSKEGIPLLPAVVEDLRDISKHTGVPFD